MQIASFLHRHVILLSVARLGLPDFSTLCYERRDLNMNCVFEFSVQLLSKTFLNLSKIQSDIGINRRRSSCEVPVILVRS